MLWQDKQLAAGWEQHGIHKGQSLAEYRATQAQRVQARVQGILEQVPPRFFVRCTIITYEDAWMPDSKPFQFQS